MDGRTAPGQAGVSPQVAFQQAAALQHQGNLPAAEKLYRAILKRHPNHFGTLYNLAVALIGAERGEEAVRLLRKALNQEPDSAAANIALASALNALERDGEALERARRAIALNAGSAEAYALLASSLAALGRYDEALPAQSRAIELAPDRARFYYHLGFMMRWRADDPRLAALEALEQKLGSLPLDEQVHLKFALGKAYADCGDIERGFRRQIEGGALQRQALNYDEASSLSQLDELCRPLDAKWIGRHQGVGEPSPLPVFIVGMPRSGTTLVEQILSSHPKVHALGESPIFTAALAQNCGTPAVPSSLAHLAVEWPDSKLRRLGALYVEAAQRHAPAAATCITDKRPTNFRFVGLIHAALPNARIIHTSRDPVDTCLSIFSILFAGGFQPYSYDLGELGRYYRAYEKVMAHWRSALPAGVMLEVKYEQVVDDLEGQARCIVAHCGLDWDDACLSFHKANRPVRTASHAQVRQPIYRSSVGRPRPPRELLQPLLDALGVD